VGQLPLGAGLPALAVDALAQGNRLDVDPAALARRAARLCPDDPFHAVVLARWALLGRIDADPGDLAAVVAVGVLTVAATRLQVEAAGLRRQARQAAAIRRDPMGDISAGSANATRAPADALLP
jgi:hypothetical protein